MLYLNVNEKVLAYWERTIDLYYNIHLGSLVDDIESVNLFIDKQTSVQDTVYRCELDVIPANGQKISIALELENCGAAIEQIFAKARRSMLRRIRGINEPKTVAQTG
ncbi:hypothetical protein A3715_14610 [Oleiphilus sp. HI0009]|uniref:hypothetical protein n=1 Tax=unclassified Oleiphilus TaxID=2631174 RepID=UPI0007C3C39C|nr:MULTISPECIES: hypothetical protein [unclassified Oleiphilus]KZX75372.1 hypothetical protein A3715_14610 [Oleiphilus sp. HI0009]KZY65363.1 hypothetical protein A3738_01310 [Oleiphilus sp. HI0066]KZY68416.1 hypothetical protein A3739_01195 [Oleiphilus sp. HI0067]KZY69796.1 hypothetical protein A3739_18855 [Oleiphilus sp. HI0067]